MPEARTIDDTLPIHGRGQVGTPWWGMLCLIATEGSIFAYLIFAYAYLGSQGLGSWPPNGPPDLKLAVPATLLLVGSSFVLEWGKRAANRGDRERGLFGVGAALLLGGAFVALELFEWSTKPFALPDNSYSSIYFMLTGTHLVHVVVGLFALLVLFIWTFDGRVQGAHVQHRALATLYWHFVDIVWLFVFTTIYLSPRLT
ncbi:heme-copper oxidase subunit III [Sphingomonas ginkgonis]|uniref:Heme-copper oxidase subunit III n=1 Tax=Sphingomonas ginkgonis TaxID=2315330 RepID=A0A3R9YJD9_9SPHN|nr:cytochrome c oxidase subunit 3 [Sphingomonas ginkgonis]RST31277.1 heme-copper oxidase subunit III [Sphingomonas ginkgonis]